MKLIGVSLLVLASLAWAAPAADAKTCASRTVTDTVTIGVDHPDIPNCVVHPAHPYPNGICENVVVLTTTTSFSDCKIN